MRIDNIEGGHAPPLQPYALDVSGVTKRYSGGVLALDSVSLRVCQGDFFALLGPNGAGKTTLIGIISSLVNKTTGTATVFGHDLDQERAQCKSLIGLVPQEINFNGFETVQQILIQQAGFYGVRACIARPRVEKVLHQLDLWDKRNKPGRVLSGGMKRRLMIARALIHEPKLLLLDEPTAGVDVELRHSTWALVKKLNDDGLTIILTTHYLEEAENLCKHIAIIDHGRIVENTNMKTLLQNVASEVLVCTIATPLTQAPTLPSFPTQLTSPDTLEITLKQGDDLNAVFAQLQQQHITVTHLHTQQNRLETLFIALTSPTS